MAPNLITRPNGNADPTHGPAPGSYVVPRVDVYEEPTGFVLVADMPGVKPDGLEVQLDRERLTLHGRVPETSRESSQHREFVLRDYYRTFAVADVIDPDRINAVLRDGVLRVELPKAQRAQARRIPVGS